MKISVAGKPVKLWINGVLCQLSGITSGGTPTPPEPIEPGVSTFEWLPMSTPTISQETRGSYYGLSYGNGIFATIDFWGENQDAFYSNDGITWFNTKITGIGEYDHIRNIAYGNGIFVAMPNIGDFNLWSLDGKNWNRQDIDYGNGSWDNTFTYGNGKFIAIDGSSYNCICIESSDGIEWEATQTPAADWELSTYGMGKFVVFEGNSDKFMYSSDIKAWTVGTLPLSLNWKTLTYGGDKFLALANNTDKYLYSKNGIAWIEGTLPFSAHWAKITYGGGHFVAISEYTNQVIDSVDGIHWNVTKLPIFVYDDHSAGSNYWSDVVYGDNKFVAINGLYAKNGFDGAYTVPIENEVSKIGTAKIGTAKVE